jgi:hypothetical protein
MRKRPLDTIPTSWFANPHPPTFGGRCCAQLSLDFTPARDCLPYISKVLHVHMKSCPDTTEAALWALANVYYSETLACTKEVVQLVLDAMNLHRTHISVVCEGVVRAAAFYTPPFATQLFTLVPSCGDAAVFFLSTSFKPSYFFGRT